MHWSARCRARQELPAAVGAAQGVRRACSRMGDPLCSLSLCPSPPAPNNHTHASFQLTVVEGEGLTQCSELSTQCFSSQRKDEGPCSSHRKSGATQEAYSWVPHFAAGGTKGLGEAWQQVHETATVAGEGAGGRMVAPVCSHPCSDAGWGSRLSLQPTPCLAKTLAG